MIAVEQIISYTYPLLCSSSHQLQVHNDNAEKGQSPRKLVASLFALMFSNKQQ